MPAEACLPTAWQCSACRGHNAGTLHTSMQTHKHPPLQTHSNPPQSRWSPGPAGCRSRKALLQEQQESKSQVKLAMHPPAALCLMQVVHVLPNLQPGWVASLSLPQPVLQRLLFLRTTLLNSLHESLRRLDDEAPCLESFRLGPLDVQDSHDSLILGAHCLPQGCAVCHLLAVLSVEANVALGLSLEPVHDLGNENCSCWLVLLHWQLRLDHLVKLELQLLARSC
jgi:hypothetical protein